MATEPITRLHELARLCGLLISYEDVRGHAQHASTECLLAGLHAWGVDVSLLDQVPAALSLRRHELLTAGIEPVVVAWGGQPVAFELTLPVNHARGTATCHVEFEGPGDGVAHHLDLDGAPRRETRIAGDVFITCQLQLPPCPRWGYHRARIETSAGNFESLLISAPQRAYNPASNGREWGCFLPLYSLRSERNWGAGDFTDLERLAQWTGSLNGRVMGTLPLLAAFLDEPHDPSPYAPASRLAWNEFYIDVTRVPEFSRSQEAQQFVGSIDFTSQLNELRASDLVEYRQLMGLKRRLLENLADIFFHSQPEIRVAEFDRFLQQHPHVEDYARFRAAHERQRTTWHNWPSRMRDGELTDSDYDQRVKRYHLYVQWAASQQLATIADVTGGGLYLDLPLGVRPDGYDVWRWRAVYANSASAGSPPDAMWTKGQDWLFPPLHPEAIRQQGYRHVRDYLAHHLRLSRWLRIDHVMQLHRLYWIPHGLRPDQGVYVQYRPEEFYAILTLESHRCETTIIGENLGTVPAEVNLAMARHDIQKMYVVQYEVASDHDCDGQSASAAASARSVPNGSLATLNTHDMPMFAAWWRGSDIPLRQELGLLDAQSARDEQRQLAETKSRLMHWLRSEGWLKGLDAGESEVLRGILRFLAASPAGLLLVNLEDLWLEARPQNVPGTGGERPNWRRKASRTFEEFSCQPDVLAALRAVAHARQQRRGLMC